MTEPMPVDEAPHQDLTKNKKKPPKAEIPVPPEIVTAYLIVRAAAMGVLGAAPASLEWTLPSVSLLQRTYLKEPGTAKFSIHVGKKMGLDCLKLELCCEDNNAYSSQQLWHAIQDAANELIAANLPIHLYEMSLANLLTLYGSVVLDGSHNLKKMNPETILTVATLAEYLVAVIPPGVPLATTGAIAHIELDLVQCHVSAGKKARKADVTLKFHVDYDGTNTTAADATPVTTTNTQPPPYNAAWFESNIRFSQGLALYEMVQKNASHVVESEPAAAVLARTTDPLDPDGKYNDDDEEDDEMVVNVEEVKGKIDYNKLVSQFGSTLITDDLLERLQQQCRIPLHRFLRRGIFFSHRDLDTLLTCMEKGQPLYLYTGRGPSSESMHLGHLIPFLFTKWLQDAFDVPLVIQMTDDEKFIFKGTYDEQTGDNLDYFANLTIENAKDIIACGFDPNKTFLFSDLDYVGRMYPNIVRIWKAVTTNTVNGIFGFDGSSNTGKISFPAIQAAPSFASSFPTVLQADRSSDMLCLIPCAIDQDPYFRMTRDVAHKLVHKKHGLAGKPALIHSKFFPPLQGASGKMSSSDENSAVFLTDSAEDIERKIREHAFSGGQETKAMQQELGADLEVDVSYQWLKFFLDDDNELARIGADYSSGSGEYWSTGKVKQRLVQVLHGLVGAHQERRAQITDEDVRKWMHERSLV